MKTVNISNPDEHWSQMSFKGMMTMKSVVSKLGFNDNEENDCLDCRLLGAHGVVHHHPGQESLSSCTSASTIGTVPVPVQTQACTNTSTSTSNIKDHSNSVSTRTGVSTSSNTSTSTSASTSIGKYQHTHEYSVPSGKSTY